MKHQFEIKKDKENVIIIPSYSNAPLMPDFPAEIARIKDLKGIGLSIYMAAALINADVEVIRAVGNQTVSDFKTGQNAYSFWISIDKSDKIVVDVILNQKGEKVQHIYCTDIVNDKIESPQTVEHFMDYLIATTEKHLKQLQVA